MLIMNFETSDYYLSKILLGFPSAALFTQMEKRFVERFDVMLTYSISFIDKVHEHEFNDTVTST